MVVPQFINIGDDTSVPLQSIKAVGDDTSDNVAIQTLDRAGRTVDSYMWINWAGDEGDQEAWVDDSYSIVEGVSFASGTGLWVQGASAEQGIQTAGSIGKQDIIVTLRDGCTGTGNPFPVAVNLQDIVAEGSDTSDNVAIQTLDRAGRTVDTYMWINWAGDDGNQEAWVDDSYTIVEGVTFAPGTGLWVQGTSEQQSIRFPAPEL